MHCLRFPRPKYPFTFVNYSKEYLGSLVDPQQACPRDLEWPLSSAFEVQKKIAVQKPCWVIKMQDFGKFTDSSNVQEKTFKSSSFKSSYKPFISSSVYFSIYFRKNTMPNLPKIHALVFLIFCKTVYVHIKVFQTCFWEETLEWL